MYNCTAYPYVNRSFGGQRAMTLAMRPTPIAMQSKAMWMAVRHQFMVHHHRSIERSLYRTHHLISGQDCLSRHRTASARACSTC